MPLYVLFELITQLESYVISTVIYLNNLKGNGLKVKKYFKQFAFIAILMVLVVLSGGCCGDSDSHPVSDNVINAADATLPADHDNWATGKNKLGSTREQCYWIRLPLKNLKAE